MPISNELKLVVLDYLGGSQADVFACTLEKTNECEQVVLHASPSEGLPTLRDRLESTLRELGTNLKVSVRLHDQAEFARNRSLEDLAESFGLGEIVYDPVSAIENVREAVKQARSLRDARGDAISGIFYSTQTCELYVQLNTQGDVDRSGTLPVNVIQKLPGNPLIAADRLSVDAANEAWYSSSKAKQMALAASVLAFVGITQIPDARAEGPAVSGVNGKISADGGNFDGSSGSVLQGTLSAPLGNSFGAQLDGAAGHYEDASYKGAGLHLFWRDPEKGLLGIVGSTQKLGSVDAQRVGAEAEGYFGDFSVKLRAGQQSGDVEHGGFVSAKANYYATENLALSLGYESAPGQHGGKIGIEWQPDVASAPGLSLFAEAESASNSYDRTVVGVRYYFGDKKSLIKRHRQDDPDSLLPEGSAALVKALRAARRPVVTPGHTCPSGYSLSSDGVTCILVGFLPPPQQPQ